MSGLIKWEKSGLKSPLSRARGLGSAKSGTHHWIMQRVTAIGNLLLGLWLVYSLLMHPELATYDGAIAWVSRPINAILMILFIISSFYHAVLGAQVVTEDYVHHEGLKLTKLLAQRLVYLALAVACLFSILQIAL
jgi:succinate dehydrogenase / fumarate reductase membrane anchor subunit